MGKTPPVATGNGACACAQCWSSGVTLFRACDGCQMLPPSLLSICPDCDYAVCEDCQVHGCTAHTDYSTGKNSCPGVGRCICGSCNNELARQLQPKQAFPWSMHLVPPLHRQPFDFNLHHNLARGTCRCPVSNFGRSYAEMGTNMGQGKAYRRCYHGAKEGAAYKP
ncbi:hypothetical protein T484DRAFT_1903071 [Baffinella frigidus]|nr:hypothetical protein T484DRAFT_1903071 [Cryptophyta sp. CCMP2293]